MKAEQLRKSILQLAIQGKLVPQDPNDEPASVLLERIREEKQRLIKEGKIKKDKIDSFIYKGEDNRYYEKVSSEVKDITDDLPFEIPDTWVWTRFSQIVSFGLGKTPDRHTDKFWSSGIYPWFAISDLQEKATVYSTKEKISATALKEKFSGKLIPQGTLLMSFKLTVGRTSILGIDAVHNEAIISVFPIIPDNDATRNFLFNTLSLIVSYVETTDAIKGATLNSSKISSMFVPFPPLAEQIRIVKEIEKFEPLIAEYDKLEQQATKLDDEIYDKLKKSILQYAIQGKLVPQDPNDEPASVLLKRIRAEKKAKLGKKYVGSYIYKGDDNCYYEKIGETVTNISDEIPFELPENWAWIRLGYIIDFSKSDTVIAIQIDPSSWVLDLEDIEKDSGRLLQKKTMSESQSKSDKHSFSKGNVLYSKLRPYLNKVLVADEDGYCTTEILAFDFGHYIAAQYAQIYLMSPYFVDYAMAGSYGVKMPRIGSVRGNAALMPIPPFNEQRRIVERYNTICKQLKDEV